MRRVERLLVEVREKCEKRAIRVQRTSNSTDQIDPFFELLELQSTVDELIGEPDKPATQILNITHLSPFIERLTDVLVSEIESTDIISAVEEATLERLKEMPVHRFDDERRKKMYASALRDAATAAVCLSLLDVAISVTDRLHCSRRVYERDRVALRKARTKRERERRAERKRASDTDVTKSSGTVV